MDWSEVGKWIKDNAGSGAALVGSLLTGNVPAAVAAGVSLVSSATGTTDPSKALEALQSDPATVIRLKELAVQDEQNIRLHIQEMTRLDLEDQQAAQRETQTTIRGGDTADDAFVRRTRPAMAWASLLSGISYVFVCVSMDKEVGWDILTLLLTLPWTYSGLRGAEKAIELITTRRLGPAATVVNSMVSKK